jgi:tetraacyldisaccharide 4'-kinase
MNPLREKLVRAWYRGSRWLYLLRPLEVLFRWVAALRRALYRYGLLNIYRAPVPVVVVGNITVGGTGKTPVVISLVESLQHEGVRVGVISRGYGASGLASPHRVDAGSTVRQCGDEALVIHRRTGCPCVVAPSRAAAAVALLAQEQVDLLISDDGLQHYALERDLEIALLDSERDIGNGFCLPAGPLREPLARLQNVDYVLCRNGTDPEQAVHYTAAGLVNLASGEQRTAEPAALSGDIQAVAGLGQPAQFFDSLRRLGFNTLDHQFPDHHCYTDADFTGITGKPIIMTEKDAVKCVGLAGNDAWYLKISAQVPQAVTRAVIALARS